jgi:copper chaperone CopZ
MKKSIILLLAFFLTTGAVIARDIVTVVFKVEQMECSGCEKKVKDNVKFMKGVKSFKTDLNTRTVTITFDADKTTVEKLQKDFKKFKYEAQPVECAEKTEKSCCNHKH